MTTHPWHRLGTFVRSVFGMTASAEPRSADGDPKDDPPTRPATALETLPLDTEPGGGAPEGAAPVGGRVGPYRIVRVLGRGGMGLVCLAERADQEFEKRVAIKLVRAGADTEFVLRRFRHERQILAGLDHPNIARLIDGGATATGVPYLVMEYVEGEPVDEYCRKRALSVEARLRLFRTVCSAIQYAHRNLVVHRDLKPSNILVTREGVPKLLDFGIAKILSPEPAAETLTTTFLLTPDYASPEQVRGEPITTASDVYSLGVVLHEVLTGDRPYRVRTLSAQELLRVICEVEPPRPSLAVRLRGEAEGRVSSAAERLARELAGDLDTIVLMAMRKEPGRRYASVEQLSEDIRRYLEHVPVIARRDTLGYRARKFMRRHRAGVAAAALVAVSLVGGLLATSWQARLAREQKARAERRFEEVRSLARAVLFEIHDEIQDLAGATRARELLVKRGLTYLDSLAQEAGGDASLQAELAAGYLKLGDVLGRPGFANLGDRAGALTSYRKALALQEALAASGPRPETWRELATTHDRVGDTLRLTGDSKGALESYRRGLALREEGAGGGGDPLDLARSYQRIADMLAVAGDPAGALASQRRALAFQEEAARRQPADPARRRELFIGRVKMGDRLGATDDSAGALAHYQAALGIAQELADADPSNARARRELAAAHDKVGNALGVVENLGAALRHYRPALEIREALAAGDSSNAELRRDVSVSNWKIGTVLLGRGDAAAALAHFRRALKADQQAARSDPGNAQARLDESEGYQSIGRALQAMGRRGEAVDSYRRALRIRGELADADTGNAELRASLTEVCRALAALDRAAAAATARCAGAAGP